MAGSSFQIPYPRGWMRRLLRAPILLHRLGLGWLLPPNIVVLTTTGRVSGKSRVTALEVRQHGSKLYALSAWGVRADWYRNLLAHPVARLQRAGHNEVVRAVPVKSADEIWRVVWLFRRTNARLDLVLSGVSGHSLSPDDVRANPDALGGIRFEQVEVDDSAHADAPRAVRPDLIWLWVLVLAIIVGLIVFGRRSGDS